MPKTYTVATARAHLARIVSEAEAGRDVELTRRGKKVAVVLSAERYARLNGEPGGFAQAYDRFLRRFSLDEVGLTPDWAAGLRDDARGRRVKL